MSHDSTVVGGGALNPTATIESLLELPGGIEIRAMQLTAEDGGLSSGLLYVKRGAQPKVGIHIMHPRSDVTASYYNGPLAEAGYAVLARRSRWPNNDVDTVHEPLLLDYAAGIRKLKELGCEKVILLGSSGGSSLAAFYQAQATAAEGARLTETPAGDPFDLNAYDLPAADGIMMVAGHVGQGMVMSKIIDPSVVDEDNPDITDPELDMYNPTNGFVTPPAASKYSERFLEKYREAQLARIRRIDTRARHYIRQQKEAAALVARLGPDATLDLVRRSKIERNFIIYRTSADPCFVDLSIDPDDRPVRSYFSTRPDLENYGGQGFGRISSPKAWLSTWSGLSTNARTKDNMAKVNEPFLYVHYAGDCGSRMSEAKAIVEGAGSTEKQLEIIRNVDHFAIKINPDGSGGGRCWDGVTAMVNWMKRHFPV